jgi:hypothetical protein
MKDTLCDIIDFVFSPIGRIVCIPILTIVMGNIIKYLGTNDRYASVTKDMFCWAPDFVVASFILLYQNFYTNIRLEAIVDSELTMLFFFTLFANIMFSMLIITILRKFGRVSLGKRNNKINDTELTLWGGIIIPDFLGALMLLTNLLVM